LAKVAVQIEARKVCGNTRGKLGTLNKVMHFMASFMTDVKRNSK